MEYSLISTPFFSRYGLSEFYANHFQILFPYDQVEEMATRDYCGNIHPACWPALQQLFTSKDFQIKRGLWISFILTKWDPFITAGFGSCLKRKSIQVVRCNVCFIYHTKRSLKPDGSFFIYSNHNSQQLTDHAFDLKNSRKAKKNQFTVLL